MALHRSVEGSVRNAFLEMRWRDIRVCGYETQHGKAKPAENEYEKGDYDAEKELAHGLPPLGSIVAEGLGGALVLEYEGDASLRSDGRCGCPLFSSNANTPSTCGLRGLHPRPSASSVLPAAARMESPSPARR